MKRYAKYLAATTVVVAAAAIAYPTATLRLTTTKANSVTLNGYTFAEPAGGSAAVPTIFVFADDKIHYNRIGFRDKKLHFDLQATQSCSGDRWSRKGSPTISVGDQHQVGSVGGKPVGGDADLIYHARLDVLLEKIKTSSGLGLPVERCNAVITDYTLQGKLPGALLQKGFWIKADDALVANLNTNCSYDNKKVGFDLPPQISPAIEFKLPAWLRCMPTGYVVTKGPPERHGKPLSEFPSIKSVELAPVNSPLNHACPATVIFKGRFEAGRAIKGNYRLIGSDGYSSPTYPFTLAGGATRSVSWQRRVELPNTMGTLTAGGTSSWPRPVDGWLQLEVNVDEPNAEPHRSTRANYRVNCLKPPSPQDTLKSNG